MTSKEIWEFIVDEYDDYIGDKETQVEKRWTRYLKSLFCFNSEDIVNQANITIGSSQRAIPDILVKDNNKYVLDIELKQYGYRFDNSFEEQLFSYLKLLEVSAGIVICDNIYLYYIKIVLTIRKYVYLLIENQNLELNLSNNYYMLILI